MRLADALTRDYPYATGSADSYRAKAVVTFPDGLRLVRRYFLRDFRTDTPHRWLDLNGAGWERALTTDDGTIETRILKDNPPATSAWQRVSLPDLVERVGGRPVYQRWYRRRFTLPKANEGERYVLHFDRPGGHRARVILNGQVMGENEVWQQGLPFVLDVTDALSPSSGGTLDLSVRITNRWPNRLIAEGRKEDGLNWDANNKWHLPIVQEIPERVNGLFTTCKFYRGNEPLLPSGLLGPIVVRSLE